MKILFGILMMVVSLLATDLNVLHNYEEAVQKAKEENKDIYLLIVSDTCKWCRKFENTTLQDDPTINELNKSYVMVALSRDRDTLPKNLYAKRVPKHYFLTKNEEEIHSFLGCWNPEDFASFLSDVEIKKKLLRKGK